MSAEKKMTRRSAVLQRTTTKPDQEGFLSSGTESANFEPGWI